MKSGDIYDRQISASSEWDSKHAAIQGRLFFMAGSGKQGSWSARHNNLDQWLQIYLFIYLLLFSHNKDYTSITLYKDVARGPQKTTRLVRGGPLVTIILSNRTITTHNNGQYKTHYRYSRKSKTFVLNDCNVKIEVTK